MAALAEPVMHPIAAPPAPRRGTRRAQPAQRLESPTPVPTSLRPATATMPSPTAAAFVAEPAEVPELAELSELADLPAAAVSTEAAETVIEAKRIGERIKYLRQRKQMGLVELGRHTGLSASFLSQLETGRVVPTLRNLARIAMVFSKDLSYFFEPERPELFRVLRASERQRLPQTGVEKPGYFYESLGHIPSDQSAASSLPQPIAPYLTEFLARPEQARPEHARPEQARPEHARPEHARPAEAFPEQARPAHCHEGREFLYMLSGRLQLAHDANVETLEQGDAVYFDAAAPHSYERLGDAPCTAMILTLPEPPRGNHTGSRIPLVKPAAKKR
jgi:transcriptional regulator with XRE-family HTH domain